MSPKDEAFGSTYPHKKWIFIGAKLTNVKNREQEIRGTIAHEFCHYILYLIFDNNLRPYAKKSKNIEELFDAVVKVYSQWFHSAFTNGENEEDDGCNHIIMNVYKKYSIDKHHQELIVRVPEIFTYFDGDDEKIGQISKMYKPLFIFYEVFVLPALKSFNLKDRECVRMFNKISGVLQKIWSMEYDLKDWRPLTGSLNRNIIITTNNPRLLLRNICYCLFQENHQLFNTKSIFMAPKCLENEEIFSQFNEILPKERNFDCFVHNADDLLKRFKTDILSVDSDVSMENVESLNEIFNNFNEISTWNNNNFNSSENISDDQNQDPLNVTPKINIIFDFASNPI